MTELFLVPLEGNAHSRRTDLYLDEVCPHRSPADARAGADRVRLDGES
ncbi:hypothetical protein ABGB12_22190 [Actinocorallia sp. B10E7]